MALAKTEKIWMNGTFVDWDAAKIHVLSHVVHYGSALFEGLRCYKTVHGPAAFRLQDHIKRLYNSCKIYRMAIPFTQEEFCQACLDTIKINKLEECYVRPIVYRGYSTLGVNPFDCPVDCTIAVWKWGQYLGDEAVQSGVDVMVSTWNRMAPNTFPFMAKSAGNYMNSQLIKMEAVIHGFVEGIALDIFGYVSEGSGENIFLVMDGKIITPPLSTSILPGITRDCVITLARSLGYKVVEHSVPREALYLADEVFFTGSAAEITPIRSIDKITVGRGTRGPITEKLQAEFFSYISGKVEDKFGWLTFVE
jgi:branched-chain amino acid aminotransferase